LIWGQNRQQGADVWLTIAHRSDCRLLPTPRRGSAFIQLRVVVQNLQHTPLTVDFQELRVYWKDGQQGRVMGIRPNHGDLPAHAPQLVARNGVAQSASLVNNRLTLKWFEFAVVTVSVDCDDCEFEADFLERYDHLLEYYLCGLLVDRILTLFRWDLHGAVAAGHCGFPSDDQVPVPRSVSVDVG